MRGGCRAPPRMSPPPRSSPSQGLCSCCSTAEELVDSRLNAAAVSCASRFLLAVSKAVRLEKLLLLGRLVLLFHLQPHPDPFLHHRISVTRKPCKSHGVLPGVFRLVGSAYLGPHDAAQRSKSPEQHLKESQRWRLRAPLPTGFQLERRTRFVAIDDCHHHERDHPHRDCRDDRHLGARAHALVFLRLLEHRLGG